MSTSCGFQVTDFTLAELRAISLRESHESCAALGGNTHTGYIANNPHDSGVPAEIFGSTSIDQFQFWIDQYRDSMRWGGWDSVDSGGTFTYAFSIPDAKVYVHDSQPSGWKTIEEYNSEVAAYSQPYMGFTRK